MEHIVKSILTFALVLSISLGSSALVYAATSNELDTTNKANEVNSLVIARGNANIDTSWTTVLSSAKGFNRNITVCATTFDFNGILTTVPCDIRLLGKSGNEIWRKGSAVPGSGKETTFWCGSDVYTVQIRTTSGKGIASAW